MKVWDKQIAYLMIILLIALFSFVSPAPAPKATLLEQAYLPQLNKPWLTPNSNREGSGFPRKGEYPCKGKICRAKPDPNCPECQYELPLTAGLDKFETDFRNK